MPISPSERKPDSTLQMNRCCNGQRLYENEQTELRDRTDSVAPRDGRHVEAAGGPVPSFASQPGTRTGTEPPQHPVPQVRRIEVRRSGPRQRPAGVFATGRESNPRDSVSALRILLLLPGIGPKKASQLVEVLVSHRGDFNAWTDFKPPAASSIHWPVFLALLKVLSGRHTQPLELSLEIHHVRKFYAPLLEQKFDDAFTRARDLEQIERMASRFESRSQFLNDMTLDPPSSTQDFAADPYLGEDYLTLSTIHSAKGLEWESVFVLHAADGNIPSDLAPNRTPRSKRSGGCSTSPSRGRPAFVLAANAVHPRRTAAVVRAGDDEAIHAGVPAGRYGGRRDDGGCQEEDWQDVGVSEQAFRY